MAKIEKYLETKCYCFFLHIHTKFQVNRLENTDSPLVHPIPDPNWTLYPKWRRL